MRGRTDSRSAVRLSAGAAALAVLVALWWWSTRDAPTNIPRPADVVAAGADLITSGDLLGSLLTSLGRVGMGFLIAFVVGAAIGILMARIRVMHQVLDPIVETLRPIAPVALVPLAILWLGTGPEAAVGIIAYAAVFPIVLNAYAAVRDMGDSLIGAARTFGASPLAMLTQVVLPGSVPGLVVGARLGVGLGWASVIAAELAVGAGVGSTVGIGQLMYQFYQFEADPNPIVVCMIAVGLTGLLLDTIIREIGRLLMPWRAEAPRRRARTNRPNQRRKVLAVR